MRIQRCEKEIQAEDIKLEVICLEMIFKAMKLDERTKGMTTDRKENRSNDEPWGIIKISQKEDTKPAKDTEEKQSPEKAHKKTVIS